MNSTSGRRFTKKAEASDRRNLSSGIITKFASA